MALGIGDWLSRKKTDLANGARGKAIIGHQLGGVWRGDRAK